MLRMSARVYCSKSKQFEPPPSIDTCQPLTAIAALQPLIHIRLSLVYDRRSQGHYLNFYGFNVDANLQVGSSTTDTVIRLFKDVVSFERQSSEHLDRCR